MKNFICLALVTIVSTSLSQIITTSSLGFSPLEYFRNPGYKSLYNNWPVRLPSKLMSFDSFDQLSYKPDVHTFNSHLLSESRIIRLRAKPGSNQIFQPFVARGEYPQNINLVPTSGQYAQLIKIYSEDIKTHSTGPPLFSLPRQLYWLTFYLYHSTLMKYFLDVQQLINFQAIQTEHAPINAAFEMIDQMKISYGNMSRNLKSIQFDEHKIHQDIPIIKEIILKIMPELITNQGSIKGTEGILRSYQMDNTIDNNTKLIIDKLRATFQSIVIINIKTVGLLRESLFYLDILNKPVNNDKLKKVIIPNRPILTDQTYAKLIDDEAGQFSQIKLSKSRFENYYNQITLESNLATSIKSLEDLKGLLKVVVLKEDNKLKPAPFISVINLFKQAIPIIEQWMTNITPCQLIARENIAKSENPNNQLSEDEKWNHCTVVLRTTEEQLSRMLLTLGRSVAHFELYQKNNVHPDDNNLNSAINELMGYMIVPQTIIIRVQNLINESLNLINH